MLCVALSAALTVPADLGPLLRVFDTLARGQVTGHELDTLPGLAAAPAEHLYLAAGVPQPGDDEAPERARAACHQNMLHSISSLVSLYFACLSEARTGDKRARADVTLPCLFSVQVWAYNKGEGEM